MRNNYRTGVSKLAVVTTAILLSGGASASAQQQVNLSAGPATLALPDGNTVPMWGYTCGAPATGSTATCAALGKGSWSPVVITVPTGQGLTINLTNNLKFSNGNTVPTSIVIVGQLGGGLGKQRTTSASPTHGQQSVTWPTVPSAGANYPPTQGPRVQSFATEVAPGATTSLTWANLNPGTYLIESGTHPSIQGPMGLYGMLVVTHAATPANTANSTAATAGTAYPNVAYDAEVPLLFSEIDPVQNTAVNAAVNTAGFSETKVWSGQPGGCGNPGSGSNYQTCYPPAVNYRPLYYMINGQAFDKTNAGNSLFASLPASIATPSATGTPTGQVLVRFVNAGLRMHVPSIVGSQTTPLGSTATTKPSAVPGFSLIAEDGNPLPGVTRVQNEVFMAAGKTYDVMINGPASGAPALPVYDRELSLSGNASNRDAGMLAYIGVNGGTIATTPVTSAAQANADTYNSVVAGQTLTVSDPSKGVLHNDVNVYGVKVATAPTQGTLTLNPNGTFTYVANSSWATSDSFVYCGNGATLTTPTPATCATVTLGAGTVEAYTGITVNNLTYNANTSSNIAIKTPGVLAVDKDGANLPLKVNLSSVTPSSGLTVYMDVNGGFTANLGSPCTNSAGCTSSFTYTAQNSQATNSSAATVTINFPAGNGLTFAVVDSQSKANIGDYRWIIEEDKTFYINPNCTTNTTTPPASCKALLNSSVPPTMGTNFHTSHMPFVAQGCTGPQSCGAGQSVLGQAAACDVSTGTCRTGATQATTVFPNQVPLDPNKRYYISVLPGDAATPFYTSGATGHSMSGAPIVPGQSSVTVLANPTPYPTGQLSVMVFEDDFPLNGEEDSGGGVDVLSPQEPGLGGFNIQLWDDMGGSGDPTGQMTYDMFNQPLSNGLAGTIDPTTGIDACPISAQASNNPLQAGITGTIVTCPKYESDGKTLSPLAGQALVKNLMPGRFGVVATPGADRIARGEEWLQTNTLDGQKAHDSFIRVGEPSFFQEFGPAGYHVAIGFANPAIINGRLAAVCNGSDPNITPPVVNCANTVTGKITTERMSRTPDERLYSSGSRDSFAFTQCYVSIGDPDGEDFAFTKCAADGTFKFTGIPDGQWRITPFDEWNDQLVDGLSTPVALNGGAGLNMGDIPVNQWQANVYTRTFIDENRDGVSQASEGGIPLIPVTVRYRDGSLANNLNTDFTGTANFNETFPLFNWYVVETDTTRYKTTGIHTVYDAGGPADGSAQCGQNVNGNPNCGTSTAYNFLANTNETNSVPSSLRVPGAVYCPTADCGGQSIANGPGGNGGSTGRIDPPWVAAEGWQGFSGQNNFIEFGKRPYIAGENGGIRGHVVYASTRPFDDPQMLVQTQWEPLVPNVTMNLYQEGFAADGVTPTLTLVDTTQTTSWDDWAQGFRSDGNPNMNCPGQSTSDMFYFSLESQPDYLDLYNASYNGGTLHTLPNKSQYKCYDGMHNWNQLQPAPYDGMYSFPSVKGINPQTGKPTGTNCTACTTNPDASDPYRSGQPMLPPGKYVVEVVVPPGYELVKEEDKNILIGDNFIAPVTQEFGGLGNIFILPDQAAVGASYNANNKQNPTSNLGTTPSSGEVPGFLEPVWPCVGTARVVPDYISLYPQSKEVAPFAGATRNLCDRKEVTLTDQMGATAKFYIFTSTHIAAKFTGVITDDFTSEFDPFSPQFGEKFAPPNMPVSIKDWEGNEVSRVYTDQWGTYDGLQYSSWEVNPPNPTGYSPTMMVFCMNDPGTGATPDPLFNPGYSQFCYELPFMPGQTQYLDTPVVPTSAFSEGYNHPDCAYPTLTPAISSVIGDVQGPWVSAAGKTLTINALGDQQVLNYGYSGPQATNAPFNQKTISRHYGFGSTQGTGTVTIGGVSVSACSSTVTTGCISAWSDAQIVLTVPNNIPACTLSQQAQYGGSNAQCGQLVITAANGQQSVDAVTVTVGGKAPTVLASGQTIQSAIDGASPGDLIIVPPGNYHELVLMWKPVRLQGAGAASTVLNANAHPAGIINPWRREVNCLFGLTLSGRPVDGTHPYDPSGTFSCTGGMSFAVDRLPLEAVLGWDATLNGNLAEQLQEPSLMGAYEGAGITVLSKGVKFPSGSNPFGSDVFPTGTTLLDKGDCHNGGTNPYPSNFLCNPSRIDGLSITDSSVGGGGIFVHGWGHDLEISNNRVYNNMGTLGGGLTIGQGEFPPAYIQGGGANEAPGSCKTNLPANVEQPFCFNQYVNVHNNAITLNSSIGDELYSGTPAGAGGINFCNGADYYKFNYNWVCGNMSTGDGGGLAHLGFSYNGDIEHNSFLFNQSLNPTIATNGGAIVVMGTPDTDPVCGVAADADCPPGLSDGTGPGLVINANLIQGNGAESGSGGGIRLQQVNGSEVTRFPRNANRWYEAQITNNIIVNNLAGWDGGGISLQDALNTQIVNNTIVSNITTATSGVLFNTIGAPNASAPGASNQTTSSTTSAPQPAGVVTMVNSPVLIAGIKSAGAPLTCPTLNPSCTMYSNPVLANNILWQNASYYIGVGAYSGSYQQNVVSLYNAFTKNLAPVQPTGDATTSNGNGSIITGGTGACIASGASAPSYWDIGVRGDKGPSDHSSQLKLSPEYSIITDVNDYPGNGNMGSNPSVVSQYCNGSRTPPEYASSGFQVPPGISDATVPNPLFTLIPAATVDEGNNWVNLSWGPLSVANPVTGAILGNYAPAKASPAIDYIALNSSGGRLAPPTDFFGNKRPDTAGPNKIDIGAVEYQGTVPPPVLLSISPTLGTRGNTYTVTLNGSGLTGTTAVTVGGRTSGVTVSNIVVVNDNTITASFALATNAPLRADTVTLTANGVTTPGGQGAPTFTVNGPSLTSLSPNSGLRGNPNLTVTLTGAGLTTASAINVRGGSGNVTANITKINSDTSITASFNIPVTASQGRYNVSVVTGIGATNGVPFTVTMPRLQMVAASNGGTNNAAAANSPALNSALSANRGVQNSTVTLTFTGSGLSGVTQVVDSAAGITFGTPTVVDAYTVTATANISANAALGNHALSLTGSNGSSNTVNFRVVAPPPPDLTNISPNSGTHGTSVNVTLTGANFTATGTTVNISGSGVTAGTVTVNPTLNQITTTFTISSSAGKGARRVTVSTSTGTSGDLRFSVK